MDTLNQVVNKYLKENGITTRYFSDYIGCEYSKCIRWLKGQSKITPKQIKRTHDFLNGKFIKTVDEILKEG